jgi:hypothetical protein
MLADAHRRAAEGIERALKKVWPSIDPDEGRLVIEGAWSASFHWIAYACQTKHRQHQESHARLGSFLRGLGETKAADWWERQDRLRQGGLYGAKTGVTGQIPHDSASWACVCTPPPLSIFADTA